MTDEKVAPELRGPTTISTRLWASKDIADAGEMIVQNPKLLSPDLLALAQELGPKTGGFPLWLVHGLAARHFRQWLEQRALPPAPATPEDEKRRGMRPRREAEPGAVHVSERALALREERDQHTEELKTAKGSRKKLLGKRIAEIEKQLGEL